MSAPDPAEADTFLDRSVFRPLAKFASKSAQEVSLPARGTRVVALVVGLSGASLLRYALTIELVAGAVLLVLYAVIDRAAVEMYRARAEIEAERRATGDMGPAAGISLRVTRAASGVSHFLVGLVTLLAVADHVSDEGGSVPWIVLGLGSAALQAMIADHFVFHDLDRSTPGGTGDDLAETDAEIKRGPRGVAALLLPIYAVFLRAQRALGRYRPREAPTHEAATAHGRALGPVAAGWLWLGHSTHIVLLAFLVGIGMPGVYAWIRLTVGNLALFGLYAAQLMGERALDPPAPAAAVAPPPAPAIEAAQYAPPAAPAPEPPPAEKHQQGPISWRPPS